MHPEGNLDLSSVTKPRDILYNSSQASTLEGSDCSDWSMSSYEDMRYEEPMFPTTYSCCKAHHAICLYDLQHETPETVYENLSQDEENSIRSLHHTLEEVNRKLDDTLEPISLNEERNKRPEIAIKSMSFSNLMKKRKVRDIV